jgi:hypothetical protein
MVNISTFAVGMRAAGARALGGSADFSTWYAHAAAHATAPAAAAQPKRRAAATARFVDGGNI